MQIITVTGSVELHNDADYRESVDTIAAFIAGQYCVYGANKEALQDVKDILLSKHNIEGTTVAERVDIIQQAIWSFDSELCDDEHVSMETTRNGILLSCTKPETTIQMVINETAHYNPSANDYATDNAVVTVDEFKATLYAEAAGHNGETNRSALALLLKVEDSENPLDLDAVLHRLKANGYTGPQTAFFMEAPDRSTIEPYGTSQFDSIHARLVLAYNTGEAISDFLEFAPYSVAHPLEDGGIKWVDSDSRSDEHGYPVNLVILAADKDELDAIIIDSGHLLTGYTLPVELEDLNAGTISPFTLTATKAQRKPRGSVGRS
jgi:hypothetical protein